MSHLSSLDINLLSQVGKTEPASIFDTSNVKAKSLIINSAQRRIMVSKNSCSRLNFLRLSFFLSSGDDKSLAVLVAPFQ